MVEKQSPHEVAPQEIDGAKNWALKYASLDRQTALQSDPAFGSDQRAAAAQVVQVSMMSRL